ncbi:MAG: ABC transporter ATP-binding protein/permease [Proteobacteria bacterium]|nr:ABC transporter ATP-binding protein/permease [Pseudomonadota bacterium]MBU1583502.1 ABC transporter ATP-binding protein/permease [Pseudomonadota bacterium]MBU2455574.1 ABC transporter ATP-binding protein/permease [Pseudomonadota bacterium]MBU2627789.1 ABC transporter ATP-binding protein/permease [Pseudomonadota bacterium]
MTSDSHFQEKEIKLANLKVARALWPFIKPYSWMLCISTLLIFMVTFFELLMPIFTQKAFDGFIVPVGPEPGISFFKVGIDSFQTFCILFSAFLLISFVIDFFQSLFMEYTGQKIILALRCALFSHMTFLPVAFYDKNSSGRLVSRVAGDVENMNEMFTSILVFIFKDLVLMTGILVILFTIDKKMAFYLSCLVPVIVISIGLFSKILRTAFRTIRQKIAEINHSFSEAITGIKIIQTTSSQNRFMQRFEHLNFDHFLAALYQIKVFSIFMPFIGFLGVLSVAIIIWTGSFEVIEKSLTLGELVAFLTYMKLFFRPLRELSEKFNLLQNALASAERIINILKTDQAKQRTDKKRHQIGKISSVTFDQVSFSYKKNKQVLKNVSFHLPKNCSLGIVGQTGSGKSSIINLITGFYKQNQGNIFINHINTHSVNIKDIRAKTALVMQDPILFSGSIRENITPSEIEMDALGLEKALLDANCDFLFEKFSGLDTKIEEGGRPLSSGEKQLVCIARAFAFNPDLIIFDEATSYMDSQSEQKVHDAMKKLMKGRLSIIIAHRLSTVKDCDTILLLRDGTIREQGSHQELVAAKGEYYYLLKKEII